jgi:hypothetical protein
MTKFEVAKKNAKIAAMITLGMAIAYPVITAFLIGLAHMVEAWVQ